MSDPNKKIAKMLSHEDIEMRIAAAMVIREITLKGPHIQKGLKQLLKSGEGNQQRAALNALAQVGTLNNFSDFIPFLASRNEALGQAALQGIINLGEKVIPKVRKAMETSGPLQKRMLDKVLAQVGGKEAFSAILESLAHEEERNLNQLVLGIRPKIKAADKKLKAKYATQVEHFLKKKQIQKSVERMTVAVKLLGYLEDKKAIPTLISITNNQKSSDNLRLEALVALRTVLAQQTPDIKVINTLIKVAKGEQSQLAQAALFALGNMRCPARISTHFEQLAHHPEFERARLAIYQLSAQKNQDARKALVSVVLKRDGQRAELAAAALDGDKEAVPLLASALPALSAPDRAWRIQKIIRPHAQSITPATRKKLLDSVKAKITQQERGWEAALEIARHSNPNQTQKSLRELVQSLKRTRKYEKASVVQKIVCRSEPSGNTDWYELASLLLRQSAKDTHPKSRQQDEALQILGRLAHRGFKVPDALRKDRSIDLDASYYVGFHFAESGHPFGEDLLGDVAKKGGRKKIGRMAKNKLKLMDAEA